MVRNSLTVRLGSRSGAGELLLVWILKLWGNDTMQDKGSSVSLPHVMWKIADLFAAAQH